jgi:hypothetical protein
VLVYRSRGRSALEARAKGLRFAGEAVGLPRDDSVVPYRKNGRVSAATAFPVLLPPFFLYQTVRRYFMKGDPRVFSRILPLPTMPLRA